MDGINNQLDELELSGSLLRQNVNRKGQVGSGMRGDKRRTYRFQDDSVYDSVTGKSARLKDVMRGNFDLLWPQ
jgi:peptide chain release factor 1